MKKVLSLFTVLILVLSFSIGLTGCNEKQPSDGDSGYSQAEVSAIYKQAAKSVWAMLGFDDPTAGVVAAATPMSIVIPDLAEEQAESESHIDGAKHNLAIMNLYINFIGDLYANKNFVLTDKVVTFNAAGTMGDVSYDSILSMYNAVDEQNSKIYIELGIGDPSLSNYTYFVFDVGYDFAEKVAKEFRMIYYEPGYVFNDQKYTAEGKFYLSTSNKLSDYQESLDEYVADFNLRKADGVFLTERFDEEFQRITNLAEKLIS